ncbi:MAG: hypothetical protein CVU05_05930 [Bacteroidetes bacterium HGW-Bacteroidetes-21]|nr:MAG: hypothetical protein CVU05_05930 [Bacteroidetes bacterium HGW-Bacteroidetes-21]
MSELFSQNDSASKALKIYISCSDCDMDFIRKEINYVNYVRDRHEAEVYIITTEQNSGSGGIIVTLDFIGQQSYAGMNDTLKISLRPDDTDDVIRNKSIAVLKAGLMRYVARTPYFDKITITSSIEDNQDATQQPSDPWDSWVFKLSSDGYFNGEKTYKYNYLYSSFSANRITEKWKYESNIAYQFNKTKYIFEDDDTTIITASKSFYNNYFLARALNNHFSLGLSLGANSSSYSNIDFSVSGLPAIEYNVFPYSESTRKQLRIQYKIGFDYNDYHDTTIYNKTEEALLMHSLSMTVMFVQKWGSLNVNLYGSNYFHDFSKNQLSINGNADIKLFKGLSLTLYAYYAFVHNQLSLPKEGVTYEETITRQRELATTFNYYTSIGISYTFGSIYNNVVNPRFGD